MNPIFADLPTTVFERMSALAREHGAINLGQGFPEIDGPLDVREAAARAVVTASNQYPPMLGLHALRGAVAAHYARFQGLDLDWPKEVIITSGATEALAASIFALLRPGDEVVMFQPLYDAYEPLVRAAGGTLRLIRLSPPDWRFTEAMLAEAFTPKTRLVIFNSPCNPTGTVHDRDQLELLAHFCIAHNAIAVCDEVWEHVVFDGRAHIPLMTLPGMRERTVKIGSAGKIFSLTGWKVGFVCASPEITAAIGKAHQFVNFSTPPNLQHAVAYGLGKDDAYFTAMRAGLGSARDRLAAGLRAAGFAMLDSAGTYFSCLDLAASGFDMDDETFAMRAVREAGVAVIPLSAFYAHDPVRHIVRLCFSKTNETLDQAVQRLAAWRKSLG
jgi:aspartate/methionine/tyrosine aminotransferase